MTIIFSMMQVNLTLEEIITKKKKQRMIQEAQQMNSILEIMIIVKIKRKAIKQKTITIHNQTLIIVILTIIIIIYQILIFHHLTLIIKIQALDITDDNYDDIVGQKKYVLVEFYTKWCRFCQLLSPEYDRLVDILKETRKDVIIGRLEADMNDITRTKYGINQFPILALFMPNSKRIVGVYQGNRQAVDIANWINQNCPKIEIKEDEEKTDNKEEK